MKYPKLGSLNNRNFLIIPEVISPRSKQWQDWFLLRAVMENLLQVCLLASGGLLAFLASFGL